MIKSILIADDDIELRTMLVEQLGQKDGLQAKGVETGAKAIELVSKERFDLIIMDVGLPDIDGIEAIRMLRQGAFKSPIIVLTGDDSEARTVLGFEVGADDYVTKPFALAVLLARIRSQLSRHDASEHAMFTIGSYSFRPASKLLIGLNGRKVRLTHKETAILRYLYQTREKLVSRETLLQEV